MLLGSIFKKNKLDLKMDALERLKEKCDKSSILQFRSLCSSYVFTVHDLSIGHSKKNCEASIAVAEYRRCIYAVMPVKGISGERYKVYEYFIKEKLSSSSTVIVFSQKDYEEMIKYSHQGKPLSIIIG